MVTAYFLAEKQGNRKNLAIGLTVKTVILCPVKIFENGGDPMGY